MRFTIGSKIGMGFGALIFLTLIAFGMTLYTLRQSREISDKINDVYFPSVNVLNELNSLTLRSRMLIISWKNTPKESENKLKLHKLIKRDYPQLKTKIMSLAKTWNKEDQTAISYIFTLEDSLFQLDRQIMESLQSFDDYEDAEKIFRANSMIEDDDGDINLQTRQILNQLGELRQHYNIYADQKSSEMLNSFSFLQLIVVVLGITLPLGGIIIAILTVNSIVRPLSRVKNELSNMSKGVLTEQKLHSISNDEIGEMTVAMNNLLDAMKLTTEFAKQVGAGNFGSYYKPLSEKDTLGHALLKMRIDLRENERVLEAKVIERTEEVVSQKEEIELKNKTLEILYKHITDSIRYAKRIQEAILPPIATMNKLFPQAFILFKPKDIVSGDFYWINKKDGKIYTAAVDCTGHGVPGAFMSIVGYNLLNQGIKLPSSVDAGSLLDNVSRLSAKTIKNTFEEGTVRDGMDLSLCVVDMQQMKLDFAGAMNPMILIRKGELIEMKGDKMPIGAYEMTRSKFTNHQMDLQKGDMIYLFSDGYVDQFGGEKGKKFMVSNFRKLLLSIWNTSPENQKMVLENTLEKWKDNNEQVDDILVIGIRI
jgi:serine phosphatase RsbU (regulator of sigma subunit)/CHASE3 domain sensor protein